MIRKSPYSIISPKLSRDLIQHLKSQPGFIRARDICNTFAAAYPEYHLQDRSETGRRNIIGHILAKMLKVRTCGSGYGTVFENVYSEVKPENKETLR